MTEEARAVAEVAKTGGEIVKAAGGLGAYLAGVVGSIPHDVLGLLGGDWLKHKRARNLGALEANTAQYLEGLAPERLSEPSPSVVIPLLQAAIDEDREDLQRLWAAMLANAMADRGTRIRRDFFRALKEMEPADALLLDAIANAPPPSDNDPNQLHAFNVFVASQGLTTDEYEISAAKLTQLECIRVSQMVRPRLTAFGRAFIAACTPPAGPSDLSNAPTS